MTEAVLIDSANDKTFSEKVLESDLPVIVDFWAPWCVPCKQYEPVLNAFAATHEDSAKVVKVNVEEAPQIARAFAVRNLPTTMVFKGGKVQLTLIGSLTLTQLEGSVAKHL